MNKKCKILTDSYFIYAQTRRSQTKKISNIYFID